MNETSELPAWRKQHDEWMERDRQYRDRIMKREAAGRRRLEEALRHMRWASDMSKQFGIAPERQHDFTRAIHDELERLLAATKRPKRDPYAALSATVTPVDGKEATP
jgi:hypothetical protein